MAAVRPHIVVVDEGQPAGSGAVSGIDRYQYHVGRARAELDAAYRAAGSRAAAAHLSLFLLHLEEARSTPAGAAALGDTAKNAEIDWMERSQPLHRHSLVAGSLEPAEA